MAHRKKDKRRSDIAQGQPSVPPAAAAPAVVVRPVTEMTKQTSLIAYAVATAMVVSALIAGGMQVPGEIAVHLILGILVAFPLAAMISGGKARLWRFPGFFLAAVGVMYLGVSMAATVTPYRSIPELLNILSAITVFCVVAILGRAKRLTWIVLCGIAAAGFLVAAIGANEYAVQAKAGNGGWRIFSTFYNPGFLAGFLILSIIATLGTLVRVRQRGAVIGLWFAAVLQLAALSLTGTRAAIGAIILALVVMIAGALGSRVFDKQGWMKVGTVLIAAFLISTAIGNPTSKRMQAASSEGHSLKFRMYTWQAASKMSQAEFLTGYGLGSFEQVFPRFAIAGYTRLAHNIYLQASSEIGIFGAVCLFGTWFILLSNAGWAVLRKQEDPEFRLLALTALSMGVATSAKGVFDSDWNCLPSLLSAAVVAGVGLSSSAGTFYIKKRMLPRWPAVWMYLCGGILILGCISTGGNLLAKIAAPANEPSSPEVALRDYKQALGFSPWDTDSLIGIARIESNFGSQVNDDVRKPLEKAAEIEPKNSRIPRTLSHLYASSGDDNAALKAMRDARFLDPKSPILAMQEAELLNRLDRPKEALEVYRKMVKVERSPYGQVRALPQIIEVSYAWAYASIGNDQYQRGKVDDALVSWKKAEDILTRYLDSLKELVPMLEAGGMRDLEMEKEAERLLEEMQAKIALARAG